MPQPNEIVTFPQLAEHNSRESLWIGVHGHVYDLTTFASSHPGGIEVLEDCAGTDGTDAYEYAGHSERNMAKLQQYWVGELPREQETNLSIPLSPVRLPVKRRTIRSTICNLRRGIVPGWALAEGAILMVPLSLAALYGARNTATDLHFPFVTLMQENGGYSFWAGIVLAFSISLVGFIYLYRLFQNSLDYQNDVFSFPPTIPRKVRKVSK